MIKDSLIKDREIASKLRKTWFAFFDAYGRLTDIQREVIPRILEGKNVLVCSATASGKTEAVCAPLIEKYMSNEKIWTILYIAPTKALVNDMYERLYEPMERLSLKLVRRSGDYSNKINYIPQMIITTPESFDSMLCRNKLEGTYGHVLSRVKAIIIDEIHLLYGSARGEQLQWLIERIKRLKNYAFHQNWCDTKDIQIVGLSATMANPQKIADMFMKNAEVVVVHGMREIEVLNSKISSIKEILPEYIANIKSKEKILVFSNTRKRVDELTAFLRKILNNRCFEVVAHHSSLSKNMRESAENTIKNNDMVIAVATSTMELGIDIGDIDTIVLDGPPLNIPSLLQRIGRGNRRTNKVRVLLCAESKKDAIILNAMVKAAKEGWLGLSDAGPNYHVAFQQIASYIFQAPNRSRKREILENFLQNRYSNNAKLIIDTMIEADELIEDEFGIRLGEYWLNKLNRGEIHSTIEYDIGYSIVDDLSGEKIAEGVNYINGDGLNTGGHYLQIKNIEDNIINVSKVKEELSQGEWRYTGRKVYKGNTQALSLRRYLGINNDVWPIIYSNGCTYVFHLGGTGRQLIIKLVAVMKNIDNIYINDFFIKINGIEIRKFDWLCNINKLDVCTYILSKLDWIENMLCRPSANKKLPINLRIEEVKGWLNVDNEIAEIKRSKWTDKIGDTVKNLLKDFLGD